MIFICTNESYFYYKQQESQNRGKYFSHQIFIDKGNKATFIQAVNKCVGFNPLLYFQQRSLLSKNPLVFKHKVNSYCLKKFGTKSYFPWVEGMTRLGASHSSWVFLTFPILRYFHLVMVCMSLEQVVHSRELRQLGVISQDVHHRCSSRLQKTQSTRVLPLKKTSHV